MDHFSNINLCIVYHMCSCIHVRLQILISQLQIVTNTGEYKVYFFGQIGQFGGAEVRNPTEKVALICV